MPRGEQQPSVSVHRVEMVRRSPLRIASSHRQFCPSERTRVGMSRPRSRCLPRNERLNCPNAKPRSHLEVQSERPRCVWRVDGIQSRNAELGREPRQKMCTFESSFPLSKRARLRLLDMTWVGPVPLYYYQGSPTLRSHEVHHIGLAVCRAVRTPFLPHASVERGRASNVLLSLAMASCSSSSLAPQPGKNQRKLGAS